MTILCSALTLQDINAALLRLQRSMKNEQTSLEGKVTNIISGSSKANNNQYNDSFLREQISKINDLVKETVEKVNKLETSNKTLSEKVNKFSTLLANINFTYDPETRVVIFTGSDGKQHQWTIADTTYTFSFDTDSQTLTIHNDLDVKLNPNYNPSDPDSPQYIPDNTNDFVQQIKGTTYTFTWSNGSLTIHNNLSTQEHPIADVVIDFDARYYTEDEIDAFVTSLDARLDAIEAVIPSEATSSNKLADKAWVATAISISAATFRGTFNSLADLQAYTGPKDANDFAFVKTSSGYDQYTYVVDGSSGTWTYEFSLETLASSTYVEVDDHSCNYVFPVGTRVSSGCDAIATFCGAPNYVWWVPCCGTFGAKCYDNSAGGASVGACMKVGVTCSSGERGILFTDASYATGYGCFGQLLLSSGCSLTFDPATGTLKAKYLTGSAGSIRDYNCDSETIRIGYRGSGIPAGSLCSLAGYTHDEDGFKIKDISWAVVKSCVANEFFCLSNPDLCNVAQGSDLIKYKDIYCGQTTNVGYRSHLGLMTRSNPGSSTGWDCNWIGFYAGSDDNFVPGCGCDGACFLFNRQGKFCSNRTMSISKSWLSVVGCLPSWTIVDLTGSSYCDACVYPVIFSMVPGNLDGTQAPGMVNVCISNFLNTNKPSWAAHNSGFTLTLDLWDMPSAWGTSGRRTYANVYNSSWLNDSADCSVGYSQMTNSSTGVLWLRGGARWRIWNSVGNPFVPVCTSCTINSQTVAPVACGAQPKINDAVAGTTIEQVLRAYNSYTAPASDNANLNILFTDVSGATYTPNYFSGSCPLTFNPATGKLRTTYLSYDYSDVVPLCCAMCLTANCLYYIQIGSFDSGAANEQSIRNNSGRLDLNISTYGNGVVDNVHIYADLNGYYFSPTCTSWGYDRTKYHSDYNNFGIQQIYWFYPTSMNGRQRGMLYVSFRAQATACYCFYLRRNKLDLNWATTLTNTGTSQPSVSGWSLFGKGIVNNGSMAEHWNNGYQYVCCAYSSCNVIQCSICPAEQANDLPILFSCCYSLQKGCCSYGCTYINTCCFTYKPSTNTLCVGKVYRHTNVCSLPNGNNNDRYVLICYDNQSIMGGNSSSERADFDLSFYSCSLHYNTQATTNYACGPAYGAIRFSTCPYTCTNCNCFWLSYKAYWNPVICSAYKFEVICTQSTAPTGVTFCNFTNITSAGGTVDNATCFAGHTWSEAYTCFTSSLTVTSKCDNTWYCVVGLDSNGKPVVADASKPTIFFNPSSQQTALCSLVVNPANNSYAQGIRLNRSTGNDPWTTLLIGDCYGTYANNCDGIWIGRHHSNEDNQKLFFTWGCSKPTNNFGYMYFPTKCQGACWCGNVCGLSCCAYYHYMDNYTANANRNIILSCATTSGAYQTIGGSTVCPLTYNPATGWLCTCFGSFAGICTSSIYTTAITCCYNGTASSPIWIKIACISPQGNPGAQNSNDFTFAWYGSGSTDSAIRVQWLPKNATCPGVYDSIKVDYSSYSASSAGKGILGIGWTCGSSWYSCVDIWVKIVPDTAGTNNYYGHLFRNQINSNWWTSMTCTATAPTLQCFVCLQPNNDAKAYHWQNGLTGASIGYADTACNLNHNITFWLQDPLGSSRTCTTSNLQGNTVCLTVPTCLNCMFRVTVTGQLKIPIGHNDGYYENGAIWITC